MFSNPQPKSYRYCGAERDDETGFSCMGARYYCPWLGRWTTADPLGLQAGINVYLYCRAGPVTLSDPSGLDALLTVDRETNTITFSTTVHVYTDEAHEQETRNATTRAEHFYNDTVAKYVDSSNPTLKGDWNVRFSVHYDVHVGESPIPTVDPRTLSDGTGAEAARIKGVLREHGVGPGENILSYRPAISRERDVPGAVAGGVSYNLGGPEMGIPVSDIPYQSDDDTRFLSLVHETGHLLGFDDRYLKEPNKSREQPGFANDVMNLTVSFGGMALGAGARTISPVHVAEAARYAILFANVVSGKADASVSNVWLEGASFDTTGVDPPGYSDGKEYPGYAGSPVYGREDYEPTQIEHLFLGVIEQTRRFNSREPYRPLSI
ncbi:MAG: RHS repeat-associated core domain-containing protein [Patescibacteria group bacterium]